MREGMKNGPILLTPFSRNSLWVPSSVSSPPRAAPTIAPMRSGSSLDMSRPESFIAISPAAIASWMKRSLRRISRLSMYFSGSKPFSSPAMRVGKLEASNCVMGPIPLLPATIPRQDSSTPIPTGHTIPSPVTTTRRLDMVLPPPFSTNRKADARPSATARGRRRFDHGLRRPRKERAPAAPSGGQAPALLLVRVDVVHGVLDGLDVLRLLVRDLHLELLLHRHDELYDVERVGAEGLDEAGRGLDLLLGDTELLRDDALDLRLHVRCRHMPSSVGCGGFSGPRGNRIRGATCTCHR